MTEPTNPTRVITMNQLIVDKLSLNPLNADPLGIVDGDIWLRGDLHKLFYMVGGTVYSLTSTGPTGPVGPTGPAGATYVWRGSWLPTATYNVNDCVAYQGSGYICIAPVTGEPPTDPNFFDIVVERGNSGLTGPVGTQGPTGSRGPTGAQGTTYTWRGVWTTIASYDINDCVDYLGSGYICIAPTSSELPTNPAYFSLLVEKGNTGPTGPRGPTGPTGPA